MVGEDASADPDGRSGGDSPVDGSLADEIAGAETGPQAFLRALRVTRNAKWGLAVGLVFTVAVFVFFVLVPGTYRSPLWYLALAFTLATGTAGLVTFLLTLGRAVRLSRQL